MKKSNEVLRNIMEDDKLTKEFLQKENMEEMYEFFLDKDESISAQEFDEFVAEMLEAYSNGSIEEIDLDLLEDATGGRGGVASKMAAGLLSLLTMVPGAGVFAHTQDASEVSGGSSVVQNVKNFGISAKDLAKKGWDKTSQWVKKHPKITASIGLAAIVISSGAVAYNVHKKNKIQSSVDMGQTAKPEAHTESKQQIVEEGEKNHDISPRHEGKKVVKAGSTVASGGPSMSNAQQSLNPSGTESGGKEGKPSPSYDGQTSKISQHTSGFRAVVKASPTAAEVPNKNETLSSVSRGYSSSLMSNQHNEQKSLDTSPRQEGKEVAKADSTVVSGEPSVSNAQQSLNPSGAESVGKEEKPSTEKGNFRAVISAKIASRRKSIDDDDEKVSDSSIATENTREEKTSTPHASLPFLDDIKSGNWELKSEDTKPEDTKSEDESRTPVNIMEAMRQRLPEPSPHSDKDQGPADSEADSDWDSDD